MKRNSRNWHSVISNIGKTWLGIVLPLFDVTERQFLEFLFSLIGHVKRLLISMEMKLYTVESRVLTHVTN